jgi:hypothetical protein
VVISRYHGNVTRHLFELWSAFRECNLDIKIMSRRSANSVISYYRIAT